MFIKEKKFCFFMDNEILPKARTAIILIRGKDVLLGEMKNGIEKDMWVFPWWNMESNHNYYDNLFKGLWEDLGSGFRCTNVFMPYSDRKNPAAIVEDIFPEERYITSFHRGVLTLEKWSILGVKNKERYKRFNWFKFSDLEQYLDYSNTSFFQSKEDKTHPIIPYPLSQSIKNLLQQEYNPFENLDIPETLKTKSC